MGYTTQTQYKPSVRVKTDIDDNKIPTSYAWGLASEILCMVPTWKTISWLSLHRTEFYFFMCAAIMPVQMVQMSSVVDWSDDHPETCGRIAYISCMRCLFPETILHSCINAPSPHICRSYSVCSLVQQRTCCIFSYLWQLEYGIKHRRMIQGILSLLRQRQ
jgi:hypothetical protein